MVEKRLILVKLFIIYFYYIWLICESYEEWKDYKFLGYIFYGFFLLEKYGIWLVMYKYKVFFSCLKLMFYVIKEILCCKELYEVFYGIFFCGLEFIILFRVLGFYCKFIVIWYYIVLKILFRKIRECILCFFYKGIDYMFLFSKKLIKDLLVIGKVFEEKF